MDEVLLHRINLLLKHIDEVTDGVKDKTLEEFSSNNLLVRATCFSIVQVGEQLRVLKKKLETLYPEVPWNEGVAMRNFVVHDYSRVDVPQIYKTSIEEVAPLKDIFINIKNDLRNQG